LNPNIEFEDTFCLSHHI